MLYSGCFLLLFAFLGAGKAADSQQKISVFIKDGKYEVKNGLSDVADVIATYTDEMDTKGWGQLEVKINSDAKYYQTSSATDEQRMYAAGLAEGYLTSLRIFQTYENTKYYPGLWDFTNGPTPDLQAYMDTQNAYADKMITSNPDDPFWQYAGLLVQQLNGLWYGYNLTAEANGVSPFNDSFPIVFLNLVGDLLDLVNALDSSTRLDWRDYIDNPHYYRQQMWLRGRCSALVKITPEIDDLFLGHSSWFIYTNEIRIFKRYHFQFRNVESAANHMMFSSYPGYLESLDDFYVMDSGLVMLQTTNSVPNTTLYDFVTPDSLYAWQRVRIANALSKSGPDWYKYVGTANSGTYNNQYMIINYGIFKEGQPLPDDFLWVVEQIPTLVYGEDKTDVLRRGYWPSYNVPALEKVYIKSGYPEMVEKMGVEYSYDLAPRARIFRRDANAVSDLDSYKAILRYNNYLNDPIENNDPYWAVCSRGDLQTTGAGPSGCYDTKAASVAMLRSMTADVINAPSYDDLPPFDFRDFPDYPHLGIKDVLDYPWVHMESQL